MSKDDQNNNESPKGELKKARNKKKKPKYSLGDSDSRGWIKWGDGIYIHPKKNLFEVRVYRRIKVSEDGPPKQFFKRARNITGQTNAIKKRQELLEGLARLAQKYEGKDRLWVDSVEMYIQLLEKKCNDKKITKATVQNITGRLTKHTSHWNDKWLSDFTSELVEEFINSGKIEIREEKEVKPATRRNILKDIRSVFQLMVNKGIMRFNPAKGLYVRGVKKETYPEVMTHNEVIKLIDYVKTRKGDKWANLWSVVYTVAYLTGARSGELFCLVWSDIKWDSKTIQIKRNYDWKTETINDYPKNKRHRTIPMNKDLTEFLMKFRGLDHEFVLPRIPDWKNGKTAEVLSQYQKECGVNETNFHQGFRGSFITNLLLNGVSISKIQTIVGHEELSTTLKYQGMIGKHTKGATDDLTLETKPENLYDFEEAKKSRFTK